MNNISFSVFCKVLFNSKLCLMWISGRSNTSQQFNMTLYEINIGVYFNKQCLKHIRHIYGCKYFILAHNVFDANGLLYQNTSVRLTCYMVSYWSEFYLSNLILCNELWEWVRDFHSVLQSKSVNLLLRCMRSRRHGEIRFRLRNIWLRSKARSWFVF